MSGVCRFNIASELEVVTPYRQFQVNYENFSSDLIKGHGEEEVEREKLIESLKKYLEHNNLTIDWNAIDNSSTELLVNSLCILSPYKPREKQALLEAETLSKRSEMLIAMTEMSMSSGPSTEQMQWGIMSKEIDPKLLEILVCPLTKETLLWDSENNELISKKAGLAYPVKDGIPIMLPDEARKID